MSLKTELSMIIYIGIGISKNKYACNLLKGFK